MKLIKQRIGMICPVTIIFLGFLSNISSANAFSLIGADFNLNINVSVPVNIGTGDKSPVNVIYTEDDKNFELTVRTNSLFNPEKNYKFDIQNKTFWNLDLTFKYENAFFEDESTIELTGTVFHNIKPSGIEHNNDKNNGDQFQIRFPSFNLETEIANTGWRNNEITFDKPDQVEHQSGHRDIYSLNRLLITRDSQDFDELSSFTYILKGTHESIPVPEPLTILGSVAALGIGTVLKKQQLKARKS